MRSLLKGLGLAAIAAITLGAQGPAEPDWTAVEAETLRHYQTLVRFDTTSPPGNEKPAADYVAETLSREGIPVQVFAREARRPNVVARLKGNGRKRPLLIMGHTDTVNVDPTKWTHPPFSAAREDGFIYGRGTLDDKDSVTAGMMVMLLLKRMNVPLDRDVIFLAEAGEEGDTHVGIELMVNEHFAEIDAEYCYAETGEVIRQGGRVQYATVQTTEKLPRGIELIARGPAGHGSVPLLTNSIVHLSTAVEKVAAWKPDILLNDTTALYFRRLAALSAPEAAQRYRDVISPDPKVSGPAGDYLREHEPRHASMLRSSLSPTMIQAGYRVNVIPSEAKVTFDVRMLPDEPLDRFLAQVRAVVNDPAVEVRWAQRATRPPGASRLNTEAYKAIEAAITKVYATTMLPTMSTGATDMAFLRAKGVECYGVGPAIDVEDATKGFGSHSDQERLLESELHRYVRFFWEISTTLARASAQR